MASQAASEQCLELLADIGDVAAELGLLMEQDSRLFRAGWSGLQAARLGINRLLELMYRIQAELAGAIR
jgi:hypothetical protein